MWATCPRVLREGRRPGTENLLETDPGQTLIFKSFQSRPALLRAGYSKQPISGPIG